MKFLFIFFVLLLFSCSPKHPMENFTACIHTERDTFLVNEKFILTSCSTREDKTPYTNTLIWRFGDGHERKVRGDRSVTYRYKKEGEYLVELYVGVVVGGHSKVSRTNKTITILDTISNDNN